MKYKQFFGVFSVLLSFQEINSMNRVHLGTQDHNEYKKEVADFFEKLSVQNTQKIVAPNGRVEKIMDIIVGDPTSPAGRKLGQLKDIEEARDGSEVFDALSGLEKDTANPGGDKTGGAESINSLRNRSNISRIAADLADTPAGNTISNFLLIDEILVNPSSLRDLKDDSPLLKIDLSALDINIPAPVNNIDSKRNFWTNLGAFLDKGLVFNNPHGEDNHKTELNLVRNLVNIDIAQPDCLDDLDDDTIDNWRDAIDAVTKVEDYLTYLNAIVNRIYCISLSTFSVFANINPVNAAADGASIEDSITDAINNHSMKVIELNDPENQVNSATQILNKDPSSVKGGLVNYDHFRGKLLVVADSLADPLGDMAIFLEDYESGLDPMNPPQAESRINIRTRLYSDVFRAVAEDWISLGQSVASLLLHAMTKKIPE